ncbi:MAG: type II toxin-antitoxin system Phd/YefM family antitoxin [Panacagrimonas sp.]
MTTVTMHEAKTHLSKLVKRVQAGEEIVITNGKTPAARLVPIVEAAPLKERRFGELKGKIWIADDFDAPLEDFKDYM